jgi:hypothetical protein
MDAPTGTVMEHDKPNTATDTMPAPSVAPEQTLQRNTQIVGPQPIPSVASTGKSQAFQDIKRSLTEADLANPGTQKLILEMLSNAQESAAEYKAYLDRYHEVDKRAAILNEKLRSNIVNEVMFTVGIGVGCAIIGLATYFWDAANARGPLCLIVGGILAGGFALARILHVRNK